MVTTEISNLNSGNPGLSKLKSKIEHKIRTKRYSSQEISGKELSSE